MSRYRDFLRNSIGESNQSSVCSGGMSRIASGLSGQGSKYLEILSGLIFALILTTMKIENGSKFDNKRLYSRQVIGLDYT